MRTQPAQATPGSIGPTLPALLVALALGLVALYLAITRPRARTAHDHPGGADRPRRPDPSRYPPDLAGRAFLEHDQATTRSHRPGRTSAQTLLLAVLLSVALCAALFAATVAITTAVLGGSTPRVPHVPAVPAVRFAVPRGLPSPQTELETHNPPQQAH
jgi:hypothetical protein